MKERLGMLWGDRKAFHSRKKIKQLALGSSFVCDRHFVREKVHCLFVFPFRKLGSFWKHTSWGQTQKGFSFLLLHLFFLPKPVLAGEALGHVCGGRFREDGSPCWTHRGPNVREPLGFLRWSACPHLWEVTGDERVVGKQYVVRWEKTRETIWKSH